eukprot:COSAG01_NODE_68302_length_264_cov_0.945455_1_plen_38_part_01
MMQAGAGSGAGLLNVRDGYGLWTAASQYFLFRMLRVFA